MKFAEIIPGLLEGKKYQRWADVHRDCCWTVWKEKSNDISFQASWQDHVSFCRLNVDDLTMEWEEVK